MLILVLVATCGWYPVYKLLDWSIMCNWDSPENGLLGDLFAVSVFGAVLFYVLSVIVTICFVGDWLYSFVV